MNSNDTQATVGTIVSRDGTVRVNDQHSTLIGSVVNTIPGWMAIDPAGKSHQYMYFRTRAAAVDFLVKQWERLSSGE